MGPVIALRSAGAPSPLRVAAVSHTIMTVNAELEMYRAAIAGSLQRIVACMEGLDDAEIRWAPAGSANCLLVIANHTLENSTRNVMATLVGRDYVWDRDREFRAAELRRDEVVAAFDRLNSEMAAALADLDDAVLSRICEHPRLGAVPGRAVLLQAARHAAEHVGEAELTRNLFLAAGQGSSSR